MKRVNRKLCAAVLLFLLLSLAFAASCGRAGDGMEGTEESSILSAGAESTSDDTEESGETTEAVSETDAETDAPAVFESVFTQERVVLVDKYTDTKYSAFNTAAQGAYTIPGLKQGFIPQGMDVWDEKGLLLISGYFKDTTYSSSSMLFAVDLETGAFVGAYGLRNSDGSYHTSHAGGVAVTEKNLFIANSGTLYRIPLSSILEAGQSGDLTIVEQITTPTRASFCNASGGYLWVGDFYIAGNSSYQLPSYRTAMTDVTGADYSAWCVGYRLTDATENELPVGAWEEGMDYATPDTVFAVTQKIQGIAVVGDSIVLSLSYGRSNDSKLMIYENVLENEADDTLTLNGTEIPLRFLNTLVLKKGVTAMPMSEGLAAYGETLLILFESGASYYKDDGGKNPTDLVWEMRKP